MLACVRWSCQSLYRYIYPYTYIHTYIYNIYIHVSIYIIYSGESEYREGSGTLRRLAPLYLAPPPGALPPSPLAAPVRTDGSGDVGGGSWGQGRTRLAVLSGGGEWLDGPPLVSFYRLRV